MHNTKFDVNEPHENHKSALTRHLNERMHIDMNKFGDHTSKENFTWNNDFKFGLFLKQSLHKTLNI